MLHKEHHVEGLVHFETTLGAISKSDVADHLCESLGVWKVPDSFFGDNHVKAVTPLYTLDLNARDSIRYLKFSGLKDEHHCADPKTAKFGQIPFFFEKDIKVSGHERWANMKAVHNNELIKEQYTDQDWTFLNHYRGALDLKPGVTLHRDDAGVEIPKDRLTTANKIIFYKDVFLYEDDLGDFGYSSLRVRLRVQKDSAFILMRSYVRIDGIKIRVVDNRFFLDFNDLSLVREIVFAEGTYDEIRKAGFEFEPGFNNDLDQTDKVARFLTVKCRHCEKLTFSE